MSYRYRFDTPPLTVRALYALKVAATQPSLIWELAIKFSNRVWTSKMHARRLSEYEKFSVTENDGIAAVTGASYSEVQAVLNERELDDARAEILAIAESKNIAAYTWGGFGEVCYAICRLTKPTTVLETGVAFGWTSAFMLAALEVNGRGHLYSVDLPGFRPGIKEVTGAVVPQRLRHRWTLRSGSQRQLIPALLQELAPIDFFHYDSDKTYQGMKWGYGTVWQAMRAGGIFMSDDVDNDAFLEFSEEKVERPVVLIKPNGRLRVGLIRHS